MLVDHHLAMYTFSKSFSWMSFPVTLRKMPPPTGVVISVCRYIMIFTAGWLGHRREQCPIAGPVSTLTCWWTTLFKQNTPKSYFWLMIDIPLHLHYIILYPKNGRPYTLTPTLILAAWTTTRDNFNRKLPFRLMRCRKRCFVWRTRLKSTRRGRKSQGNGNQNLEFAGI